MEKQSIIIEISKTQIWNEFDAAEELRSRIVHLEVSVQGHIYHSRLFQLKASQNNSVLVRLHCKNVKLPLTKELSLTARLFVHLPHKVVMLGVQHFNFLNSRFPMNTTFPILGKNNTGRCCQLDLSLREMVQEKDAECFELKRELASPRPPITPAIKHLLSSQWKELEKDGKGKLPDSLLKGVALAVLKCTQDVFYMQDPLLKTLDDWSCSELLSQNYIFIQSSEDINKKNVYLDVTHDRVIVTKTSPSNPFPVFYNHAMCLLPNGNFLISGGNSKDATVTHQGVFYFNPRTGNYIKIAEIPFLLHKHEMHYYKGAVYIFGGCDSKKDSANNQNSGLNASTLYKFDLSTRKWIKSEKLIHKFNDRCASIIHKDNFIVNKGLDGLEIYPLEGKTKIWKTITDKKKKTLFAMPSAFFEVEGELYLLCKKTKEDINKYVLHKIKEIDTSFEGEIVMEGLEITNLGQVYTVQSTEGTDIITKAYILDSNIVNDAKIIKFKNGKVMEGVEGPGRMTKLELKTHFDSRIKQNNLGIGKINESSSVFVSASKTQRICKRSFTQLDNESLKEHVDQTLRSVHQGLHHNFTPLNRGVQILTNYFQKVQENKYKLNTTPLHIRCLAGNKLPGYIHAPSSILKTIGHSSILVHNVIFFFGGLEPVQLSQTFETSEVELLNSIPGKLEATKGIYLYRLTDAIWKPIEVLPDDSYGCFLFEYQNTICVIGGKNAKNELNRKIYIFDLNTYSVSDSNAGINLSLTEKDQLECFRVGNSVFIGADGHDMVVVYSLALKTTYTIKSKLFSSVKVLVSDIEDNGAKTLLSYTKRNESKVYQKSVGLDIFGQEIEKDTIEIEKFLFDEGSSPIISFEKKNTIISGFDSEDDIFGLDEIDLSRSQNDIKKKNKYVLLSQDSKDQSFTTEYVYSEDRIVCMEEKSETDFRRNYASVSMPHGKIFITGGEVTSEGKLIASNACWIYNPLNRDLKAAHKMKHSRIHHSIIRRKNYIYVFGGQSASSGHYIKDCERYNILSGEWEVVASMPRGISKMGIAALFDKFYMFGGELESGELSDTVLVFDTPSQSFDNLPNLRLEFKARHLMVTDVSEGILISGGETATGPNLEIIVLVFNKGFDNFEMKHTGKLLYPHIQGELMYTNGCVTFVGGNDLLGSESFRVSTEESKEILTFRNLNIRNFTLTPVKNELSVSDNFLHDNQYFDKLYIFGLDTKKEIWRVNLRTLEWEVLDFPDQFDLWNYSIAVTLPDGRIFLSGGIKHDLTSIKNSAYIITPGINTVKADQLPPMLKERYTHTSVYLNNYVYCLGGRHYGEEMTGILNDSERFDLRKKKWETISPMNARRCTASATSYNNHIYVFGGYICSGRSGGIERYDEIRNSWSFLPLSLTYPIEASNVVHITDSIVLLLGGKDQYQEQAYVTQYDLDACSSVQLPSMLCKHVLGKGVKYMNDIIVVGGSSTNMMETCNVYDWQWKESGQVRIMSSKDFSKAAFAQSH